MLASLRIRNLALVEELEWSPGPGFVAITGETGAGKSIIVGALKLVLGERADKTLIRTGAEHCTVEAVFHVKEPDSFNRQLEENGVEPGDESALIVKRSFSASGVNRQFVNGSATTLAVLKTLGDALVDLHGPHDHQSLLSSAKQLDLLDAFAGAEALAADFAKEYKSLQRLEREHEELSASEATLERETDLLRHQVREIQSASLQRDEEETLLARYTAATNSRRLIELSSEISHRMAEAEDSVLVRHGDLQRIFRELEKLDPANTQIAAAHVEAVVALEEIARDVQHYAERLELDGNQLAQLEERVTAIETLKRKYGRTVEEVIAFGDVAAARLHKIESRGEELSRLAGEIDIARAAVLKIGGKLSEKRRKAAPKLAQEIKAQLRDLGFKNSEFSVAIAALANPAASGTESIEFLFAPNPGEPAKPLKAIASSGEISRVMLAVKTALAAQDSIPLLVFDEIDANVGGEIAHRVGAKMQSLGTAHQVLCITHLPQVAAGAHSHFVVTKAYRNERTVSDLNEVRDEKRTDEIARMLGGKTDSALAHAKELLRSSASGGITQPAVRSAVL